MVTEVDPFGAVLQLLRADTALTAIVPSARISSEFVAPAPCIVVSDIDDTLRAYGPGSAQLGLQRWIGVAKVYGPDAATGAITARQAAGAARAALHGRRYMGTNGRFLALVQAPTIAGLTRDPDTKLPHYDLAIEAVAGREAVA